MVVYLLPDPDLHLIDGGNGGFISYWDMDRE